ncbi:probable ATP-dependent RNA helicase Dbp73D [Achroia grisella]|uniref:probable ATP-dependent RNA helicase Dbp73D n=1 Tax=Achroia grisella TaxID=688607 RepID=UPI0027D28317|nr:probable ATP-dependent RNA helicase Dbp73D [Achroia grisella]
MDLFVINRYRDNNEEVDWVDQESKNLEKLKQKIEERRKTCVDHKQSNNIILKEVKAIDDEKVTHKNEVKDIQEYHKQEVAATGTIKSPNIQKQNLHEFKVLGIKEFEKKIKVQRVLPYWLSHPHSVPTDLQNLSCPVEKQEWLHNILKSTLLSEGVFHLFPVQEHVIPFILNQHKQTALWPHDVCVSAPTGSGKTLSFVLPVIQILMNSIGNYVKALIVLPVQELATQVAKVFKKYCTKTGLKVALLSASTPLHQEQQQIVRYTESVGWVSEVDIIVCTAGRLVEHIQNTKGFSLKCLKLLVIDEADRIMDNIQNDWLYHLERHIKLENELMTGKVPPLSWNSITEQKASPHKLMFSATLSQDPEKLDQWGLFQPKLFSAASVNFEDENHIRKYTTPAELTEKYITCTAENKPLVLYHFLVEQKWNKVLCFTNAAQTAHRLTVLLNFWGNGNLKVAELSSALDRSTRENVLKKFTQSEINVLIGTDALARGIDIPNCIYVISYDPPRNIKTYIHRVGRTGRAGRTGHAITILLQNQINIFMDLIRSSGKSKLPQMEISPEIFDNLSDSYQYAIKQTKEHIYTESNSKIQKSIDLKRGFKSKAQKRKHDGTKN